jgi:hypothetical protein
VYNQKIECADSFSAVVNSTIHYSNDEFQKAEYSIIQGKDGKEYSAELSPIEGSNYQFSLKNENSEDLLSLSIDVPDINEVIKILDCNMDGYADIQMMEQAGALNNKYALYVWDESAQSFAKVTCDEMLSYFEVYDGYLLNWAKNDASSGIIQKLIWDKNTLVKVSEEEYQAD